MLKVLMACVWLLGSAYGAIAQAASVVFLNPGRSSETFWVSYAQFMQAGAKDLGLDLRVRYSERDNQTTLAHAREALLGTEPITWCWSMNSTSPRRSCAWPKAAE